MWDCKFKIDIITDFLNIPLKNSLTVTEKICQECNKRIKNTCLYFLNEENLELTEAIVVKFSEDVIRSYMFASLYFLYKIKAFAKRYKNFWNKILKNTLKISEIYIFKKKTVYN